MYFPSNRKERLPETIMKNRNLDNHNDWATPHYVMQELIKEFYFCFDPCPLGNDVSKFDGTKDPWPIGNIFINPPYSRKLKEAFIHRAVAEAKKGSTVVMLLPVSTSTKIFHDVILPNAAEIRFVRKRIKFQGVNTRGDSVDRSVGMFDNMIVIFKDTVNSLIVNSQEFHE